MTLAEQRTEAIDLLNQIVSPEGAAQFAEWCSYVWQHYASSGPSSSELNLMIREAIPHLERLRNRIIQDAVDARVDEPFLLLDVRHAELAEELGQDETAHELRAAAMARWQTFRLSGDLGQLMDPWLVRGAEDLLLWLLPYACAVARHELAGKKRTQVAALSMAVLDKLRHGLLDRRRRLLQGSPVAVLDRTGTVVATMAQPAELAGSRALKASQTLVAHRLLLWLVAQGNRQAERKESRDFRTIRVPGGLSGLVRELGLAGRKVAGELREALTVMQHIELDLPWDVPKGLLVWSLQSEARGRPAELRIVLGEVLLPGFVRQLPKGTDMRREARMLVPVPEHLPPLPVPAFHQAAAVRLLLVVLCELRFHAAKLAQEHWVRITTETWLKLVEEAGLPADLLDVILGAWSKPDETGFLERSAGDPDLWRLARTFERESLFIEAAGQEELRGRLRQQRSRKSRDRTPRARASAVHVAEDGAVVAPPG